MSMPTTWRVTLEKVSKTMNQYELINEGLKVLAQHTGIELSRLQNHMLVIGDVVQMLERYGSVVGDDTPDAVPDFSWTESSPWWPALRMATQAFADEMPGESWDKLGFRWERV